MQANFWSPKPRPTLERLQPYVKLNDGNRMPLLGLGTWNAQGKELKEAVKFAIQCGYRHIDTASNYRNEHLVGEAIAECIEEGLIKREDLFITTKLWNNSHSRGSVPRALARSLDSLRLSYVDLYLIHYPIAYLEGEVLSPVDSFGQVITSDVDYVETWFGMEDSKRAGLTKSIGVSNFNELQLRRCLDSCTIVPAMNQIECHPYLSQSRLLKFCRANGIAITAYSPLGSPGKFGLDQKLGDPKLIDDPNVRAIAKRHNRPVSHILIAYQLKRKVVVIPKSIQPSHIESNLEALTCELTMDDMRQLESLDRNHRYMKFERCINHKFYPFNDVNFYNTIVSSQLYK